MIAWMQRHKKYLVITIWVSAIAFIGAGFVGWGQYSYGAFARDDMIVGNVQVSKKELSMRYQEIYSQYVSLTGQPKLDKAIESQIEQMTINSLVSEALILNLAKEWNLRVLDDEVVSAISGIKAFYKDNKFDKQTYVAKLAEKGLSPKGFEDAVSKSILIQKTQKLLSLQVVPLESEAFTAAYFSGDNLSVQVINLSESGITVSEVEMKDYWSANKAKFKTATKFDLEILTIKPQVLAPTDAELKAEYEAKSAALTTKDGKKISFDDAKPLLVGEIEAQKGKKEALKTFVEFKNAKMPGKAKLGVEANSSEYPPEFNEQLAGGKAGGFIKPVWNGKEYLVAKIIKILPSAPMDFNTATPFVKKELIAKKSVDKLKADAVAALKNFSGKPIGVVSRAEDSNLSFLGQKPAQEVLAQITSSPKLEGFVILPDKAVVYKVLEQNLHYKLDNPVEMAALSNETAKYKAEIMASGIMEKLKGIYKVDFINQQMQGVKQ